LGIYITDIEYMSTDQANKWISNQFFHIAQDPWLEVKGAENDPVVRKSNRLSRDISTDYSYSSAIELGFLTGNLCVFCKKEKMMKTDI